MKVPDNVSPQKATSPIEIFSNGSLGAENLKKNYKHDQRIQGTQRRYNETNKVQEDKNKPLSEVQQNPHG